MADQGKLIGPNFSRRLAKALPWVEQTMGLDPIPQRRTPQILSSPTWADAMGGYVGTTSNNANGISTTLYYSRALVEGHAQVRLYDGNKWQMRTIDFDNAMPTITNAGLSADTWYLLFLHWDTELKKGVLTFGLGSDWFEGVIVSDTDSTKRWVALVYTTDAAEFESTPANRLVINAYNRQTLPIEAAVNTGTDLDDTDSIRVVNGAGFGQGYLANMGFHARVDTAGSPTLLTATLTGGGFGPTDWAKAYGHTVANNTYGLALSHSWQLNTSFSGVEEYYVGFSGGNDCDIIAGSFYGSIYG